MVKFGKIEMARKSLILKKKPTQILDDNVDIIVISKLVKTETNSKYFVGYLDKGVILLVLIMPKMSGYSKTFEIEDKRYK